MYNSSLVKIYPTMETTFSVFLQFLRNFLLHPFFLPSVLFLLLVYKIYSLKLCTRKNRPPSPRKLPIIGNLHQLGPLLHRSFLSLSQQYGNLMLLHLGSKPTLVVSSVDAVREIMKTKDVIFSTRPKSRITRIIFYGGKGVAFAPYGEDWRQMRSISVSHLLSNHKVQSYRNIREEETALIIEKIYKSNSSVVNLSDIIMTFTNDVLCRAAFGKKYNSTSDNGSMIFKELLNEVIELLGVICLGDFIPCLGWVDHLKGLNGRIDKVAKDLDEFIENVIQEHQYCLNTHKNNVDVECDQGKKVKAFVDILLEYQRENKDALPTDNMKAVILDMFIAGTETTYTSIEWTMCELIKHPKIMIKLQEEVRKIGGLGHKICEDDLEKLTYLKAVIKEALRLHPPVPLLGFREALHDVEVQGFHLGAGTQVVINAWAIQRNPTYWDEPEEFRPERFLDSTAPFNFTGKDNFQFIPFGGGRRICPGISFAVVNVELAVANLINEFDWKLPGGADCGALDMAESVGIASHMQDPLKVIATPYSSKIRSSSL